MIKHVKKCKKARGINPEDERDAEEFEAMQDGDMMEGSEREQMDGIFEGGEGEAIGEEENWVDLDGEEEFVGEDAILMAIKRRWAMKILMMHPSTEVGMNLKKLFLDFFLNLAFYA